MNLNLYGHAGKWLMVDLGITFGDESTPGVEVIMPDISFIKERVGDLSASSLPTRTRITSARCTISGRS
jgi:mRNA degradation ribonuclease J1/J2